MRENKEISYPFLEISLLGRFGAKIDGVAIDEKRWSRRSAKSLVKLLALKPHHTLHREQIIDFLWAEDSWETAVNNLNKAIYGARRAFEPDLAKGSESKYILTSKNQIILDSPGSISVDLDEFERLANYALRNNDLEAGNRAIELYRGDLLIEDIYEDWIYLRRESIRILFRKTATKTAEFYAANNNHQASIEILKKLIAEDATDEYVHRLLMRFYAETGSKYQALKQFEQCRAALHTLGISPEQETIQLGQIIKRGEILPTISNKTALAESSAPIISTPRITQLTFQNGVIRSANFLPDGKTIVFSAAWNGEAAELYTMRLDTNEIYNLGIQNTEVYSVSSNGEIAAALHPQPEAYLSRATLAKLSLSDGTPHEISKNVQCAVWHPSKNSQTSLPAEQFLAIVRDCGEKTCLEFPIGNVIFETAGWISHPRFSPDGKKIAFIEHPLNYDDRGFVVLLDLEGTGNKRILTDNSVSIMGLAWSNNDEIWFTASYQGSSRMIKAVNLKGEERPVHRGTGSLRLQDISKRGEILVTDDKMRVQTAVGRANEDIERNLSWHDWTLARDLTDDGETLLFEEAGVSGGNQLSAYIRKTDGGSSVKKIGDGSAIALSPDGKYALLRFLYPHHHLALVPIGEGETKLLEIDAENPLVHQVFAAFFPNGERIIFSAIDSHGNNNLYLQSIDGGKPNIFAPELKIKIFSTHSISPDGKYVVLPDSDGELLLYQISNGTSSSLKNLEKDFWLIRWTGDGENLFVWRREGVPAIIYKYNIASGTMEEWLKLSPKDSSGVYQITSIKLTPNGKSYAYSHTRESSDLFLMEDLR